jgi:hypothetical protein
MRRHGLELSEHAAGESADAAQARRGKQTVVQIRCDERHLITEQHRQLTDVALAFEQVLLQYAQHGCTDDTRDGMRRVTI